jgi:hypothetical protein
MPEEYRIWKEKVDTLTAKQQLEKSSSYSSSFGSGGNNNTNSGNNQVHKSNSSQSLSLRTKSTDDMSVASLELPKISYANPTEALEAFKELLAGKNISAVAKYKEVQDWCSSDPRWNALSSAGEKKQALSEYQVRNNLWSLWLAFFLSFFLCVLFSFFLSAVVVDKETETRKGIAETETTKT